MIDQHWRGTVKFWIKFWYTQMWNVKKDKCLKRMGKDDGSLDSYPRIGNKEEN